MVELMIGLAVSSIVLIGIAMAIVGQSQSYERTVRTRDATQAARVALSFVESKLRLASYGMDPAFAFDFRGTEGNRDATGGTTDSPDEVAFFARDPAFARRGTYQSNGLTLATGLGSATMYPGQVLMLVCPSGQRAAYVTVSAKAVKGDTTITLRNAGTTFPTQTPGGCLLENTADAQPFVFKINRYRFFLADVVDQVGARARPYLMLDQGLDINGSRTWVDAEGRYAEPRDTAVGDGTQALADADFGNLSPVAASIEDLQFAYVMSSGTVFGGDPSGTAADEPDETATAPTYNDDYTSTVRSNTHPANIRGVRVSLVARSSTEMVSGARRPALENRPEAVNADRFYRAVSATQIFPSNILTRSNFTRPQMNTGGS